MHILRESMFMSFIFYYSHMGLMYSKRENNPLLYNQVKEWRKRKT